MIKSSRHSKITGNFGEALILYWLSKSGFECALVDHTGIDIIARSPTSKEVLGISVKSRSRNLGTEGTHLAVKKSDLEKARQACVSFGCKPYYAFVVDTNDRVRCYLLSLRHLLKIYPGGPKVLAWQMSAPRVKRYAMDPNIRHFELLSAPSHWW